MPDHKRILNRKETWGKQESATAFIVEGPYQAQVTDIYARTWLAQFEYEFF